MKAVHWTPEMVAELQAMRGRGVPLYRCAERLGVGYATAVYQARALGVAGRLNVGRTPGEHVLAMATGRPSTRAAEPWAEDG